MDNNNTNEIKFDLVEFTADIIQKTIQKNNEYNKKQNQQLKTKVTEQQKELCQVKQQIELLKKGIQNKKNQIKQLIQQKQKDEKKQKSLKREIELHKRFIKHKNTEKQKLNNEIKVLKDEYTHYVKVINYMKTRMENRINNRKRPIHNITNPQQSRNTETNIKKRRKYPQLSLSDATF